MTRVGLFNRDHVEQTADAGFERPNALDIGKTGFFDAVPHLRGTNHTLGQRVIRWGPAGTRDTQNRIVAVINPLDPKHGRVFHSGTIVTEPLAKRPIGPDIAWVKKPLDGDFCMGRKGQTGYFSLDEIERSSSDPATVIVLGIAELDGIAGSQKQQRVLADAQDDGARLTLLERFFHMHPPVLAYGSHEKSYRLRVMDHRPIGAQI